MGNLERAMTRDAVAQLLADAGIHRESLPRMVREIIIERVDKAIEGILFNGRDVREAAERVANREMAAAVIEAVRRELGRITISISRAEEPTARRETK